MKPLNKTGGWLLICLLLVACGQPASTTATHSGGPATPVTTQVPDATATPSLPADWVSKTSDEGEIQYALPPGWDVQPYQSDHFDLRENDGSGWLEVYTLDEVTRVNWGLTYRVGDSAESVVAELLSAAQDDGDFTGSFQLESRSGLDALGFEGEYTAYSEIVLIGVIVSSERGLIVVGHENGSVLDWATEVRPLYLQVISTFDF